MQKITIICLTILALLLSFNIIQAQVAPTNLLVHWRLDETEGTMAMDASGKGNHGTLVNMDGNEWIAGINGNSLAFNPDTEQAVESDTLSEIITGDYTVICWYKTDGTQANGRIVGIEQQNFDGPNLVFVLNTGTAHMDNEGGSPGLVGETIIDDGEWHMCVGMRKGAEYSLWIDDGEAEAVGDARNPDALVPYAFLQVNRKFRGGWGFGFKDDARLYNKALTQSELETIYASVKAEKTDPSLVAHWPLDETEGTVAGDASGNANVGHLVNMDGTEWTEGAAGNALAFNQDNEQAVDLDSLSEVITGDYTLIAWWKTDGTQANGRIVGLEQPYFDGPNLVFVLNTGTCHMDNEGGSPGLVGETIIDDGEWHMVVATREGAEYSLWIDDGPKEAFGDARNPDALVPYTRLMVNRKYRGGWGFGFKDDIRLYNRALTETEINDYYSAVTGTAIGDDMLQTVPTEFSLLQNYPNPFNPSTTISYNLAKQTQVDLTVYNVQGQKVATLVNNAQPAGQHQVTWNAAGMPSGVYYFQIQTAAGFTQTNKMILIK